MLWNDEGFASYLGAVDVVAQDGEMRVWILRAGDTWEKERLPYPAGPADTSSSTCSEDVSGCLYQLACPCLASNEGQISNGLKGISN